MTEGRTRRYSSSGRRSPILHAERASMPSGVGYLRNSALGGGEFHVTPMSRHESTVTRPTADLGTSNIPITTTTYAVRMDPPSRSSSVTDRTSRSRSHRAATFDNSSKRPVIVTTTKHASHQPSSPTPKISSSPPRNTYRAGDEGQYYAQPASSIRARSSTRVPRYRTTVDNDDIRRLKERTAEERVAASRPHSHRPTSIYANLPRPASAAIDYGDDYEYTKPGDLLRYDVERPARRHGQSEGPEYYRPTVTVPAASPELGRAYYEVNERRSRGPPPTPRALDKVNKNASAGIYDRPAMHIPAAPPPPPPPPSVPQPPELPRRPALPEPSMNPILEHRPASHARRERPHSMHLDSSSRPKVHDDYYRNREDDLVRQEIRNRSHEYYPSSPVTARGYGIRSELKEHDEVPRRPEPRHDRREWREPQDLRVVPAEQDRRRPHEGSPDSTSRRDDRWPVRDDIERTPERDGGVPLKDKSDHRNSRDMDLAGDGKKDLKLRDRVRSSLNVAKSSMGFNSIGSNSKPTEADDKLEKPSAAAVAEWRDSSGPTRPADRYKPRLPEIVDPPKDRDWASRRDRRQSDAEARFRNRLEAEARLNGESPPRRSQSVMPYGDASGASSERRKSGGFKPTDTASLMELRQQIAEGTRPSALDKSLDRRPPLSGRRVSPSLDQREVMSESAVISDDENGDSALDLLGRRRHRASRGPDGKQVRVVSPPRGKERKPIKGILKQPSTKFPEEPNYIREGVAPHKDDKTKTNVAPEARWTKINRKLVNPEALLIGKERFEVRDDFVIVLRVLSKEEIQAYATATAQLRERRWKEPEQEREGTRESIDERRRRRLDRERERESRPTGQRDPVDHHDDNDWDRHDRDRERERLDHDHGRVDREADRERDRERRRHRHADDESARPRTIEYPASSRTPSQYRIHRDRDRDRREVTAGAVV